MELKDQVQGVVIGLFGAYAGGYFADLTSQAETGNPVALVEGLVNLQTPLLGVNLSDDAAWVDTILGHLGVSSTSAAYTAAAAWANGELDAGASRAEVVLAAVTYLLGDSVEAQYASVATAFKADVAAGVVYSEGEGAEVLAIGDLREAAGNPATGTSFNLTAALADLKVASDAVSDFVDAWGLEQTPVVPAAASATTNVYDAVDAAEEAVEVAAGAAGFGGAVTAAANINIDEVNNSYTGYKASDAVEDLALSIAQSQISTKKIALDGTLALKVTALEGVSLADATGSLQALVDTWIAKAAAYTTAQTAEAAAGVVTQTKEAAADVALDAAFDVASGANYDFAVTASAGVVEFNSSIVDTSTNTEFGDYKAEYNATTNAWTYSKFDTTLQTPAYVPLNATDAAADVNLQKLLANADAKAVLDAAAAEAEAAAARTAAGTEKGTALANIGAVSSVLITGTGATGDLASTADEYRDAKDAITAFNTAKTAFDAAVTAQAEARATGAELAALQKTAADATTEFATNKWNLNPADANAASTDAIVNDVFVFNGADDTIANFGKYGSDVIAFDAGVYTLVTVTAADWTGAAAKAVGSSTALEIFVLDTGADTVLYVEENAYDGSVVAGRADIAKITLTGVADATTVTLNANGYLSA